MDRETKKNTLCAAVGCDVNALSVNWRNFKLPPNVEDHINLKDGCREEQKICKFHYNLYSKSRISLKRKREADELEKSSKKKKNNKDGCISDTLCEDDDDAGVLILFKNAIRNLDGSSKDTMINFLKRVKNSKKIKNIYEVHQPQQSKRIQSMNNVCNLMESNFTKDMKIILKQKEEAKKKKDMEAKKKEKEDKKFDVAQTAELLLEGGFTGAQLQVINNHWKRHRNETSPYSGVGSTLDFVKREIDELGDKLEYSVNEIEESAILRVSAVMDFISNIYKLEEKKDVLWRVTIDGRPLTKDTFQVIMGIQPMVDSCNLQSSLNIFTVGLFNGEEDLKSISKKFKELTDEIKGLISEDFKFVLCCDLKCLWLLFKIKFFSCPFCKHYKDRNDTDSIFFISEYIPCSVHMRMRLASKLMKILVRKILIFYPKNLKKLKLKCKKYRIFFKIYGDKNNEDGWRLPNWNGNASLNILNHIHQLYKTYPLNDFDFNQKTAEDLRAFIEEKKEILNYPKILKSTSKKELVKICSDIPLKWITPDVKEDIIALIIKMVAQYKYITWNMGNKTDYDLEAEFLRLFTQADYTVYIHLLFKHGDYLTEKWGPLEYVSQQSLEASNKMQVNIYSRNTARGGGVLGKNLDYLKRMVLTNYMLHCLELLFIKDNANQKTFSVDTVNNK